MIICEENQRPIKFLTEKRYRLFRHLALLIAFITLHQSANILFNINNEEQFSGVNGAMRSILPFTIFSCVLYINIYLLMPLFIKRQYLQYLMLIIIVIMTALFIMDYLSSTFLDPQHIVSDAATLNTFKKYVAATIFIIPIVVATSAARLMQIWIVDSQRINELDKLTVKMELEALKNQINPHFLFNMLNNVNILVKNDPEKASLIIMKLSGFLRHQLYENDAPTTTLMAENEFLYDFLNLEKIRRDNFHFSIVCETPGSNGAMIRIPPNLFTTFVENAINHSTDISGHEAHVIINIKAEGERLLFTCTNSQPTDPRIRDAKSSGLGMVNIVRRLQLLYGKNYSLISDNLNDRYKIKLEIPL